jgi:uncharacterized membrane protein
MTLCGMTGSDKDSAQASQGLRDQQRCARGQNVGTAERWGSVIGGVALAAFGLKRRSVGGAALALFGGGLIYRGVTGHCQLYQALGLNTSRDGATQVIEVEKAITIDKSPEELYRFWRQLENLPRFMAHLQSVQNTGHRRSHWVAKAPLGRTAAWDVEITEERDNELIAWRSLEGSCVPNQGHVRFLRAPWGRGTEVHIRLAYKPPRGKLGAIVAKLFSKEPHRQLDEDLHRFKHLMEAGEIPTIAGQPSVWVSARREELAHLGRRSSAPFPTRGGVEQAPEEPCPAG